MNDHGLDWTRMVFRLPALAVIGTLVAGLAPALDGRVLLPDDTPARGATVSILGLAGSARTGPDGGFVWHPDPRPPFSVLVVRPDGVLAAPILVEVLPEAGPLVIRLMWLEESLTVSAGSSPRTEAPPASAAGVVGSAQVARRHARNIVEALESVAGADRLGGGHTAVPSLRGLARGRTVLLIDGARVSSERRAGPSATFLDPFQLEVVEVSRGLGSVVYGSDAFGGVIHARGRRALAGVGWGGRAQLAAGLGRPELSGRAELSHGLPRGGVLVQARLRHHADYHSPDGTVPHSSAHDGGAAVRWQQVVGRGLVQAGWQSDLGRDIERAAIDSDAVRSVYPVEDSHRFTAAFESDPRWGFSQLAAELFVGRYRLVTERETLPRADAPRSVSRSDVGAWDYGLRLAGARPLRGWRVSGGVDLNGRADLEAVGSEGVFPSGVASSLISETAIEDASRSNLGVYLSVEGEPRALLRTSGGIRLDAVHARNRGGYFGERVDNDDAVSGYVALTGGPVATVSLTGQLGWGFRAPTLSDRYYRGVTGRGFITGNPELASERSVQYDLALRRAGRLRGALYAYRYEIRDLIERYRAGADFFFRNRGRALIEGVELEIATHWRGVQLDLAAHAVRGRALDDATPLADVPATSLALSLARELGAGDLWARVRGVRADETPGPTETPTPGYVVVDAAWSHRLTDALDLRLSLQNLFDARYPDGPDEVAELAPGRAVGLTVTAVF